MILGFLSKTAVLIGALCSIGMCIYFRCTKVKIQFNYSALSWAEPILLALGMLMLSFTVDLTVGYVFSESEPELVAWLSSIPLISYKIAEIIIQLLINGVLIPAFCAVVSLLFGFIIRQLNFDYLRLYSVSVPKVILSVLTVLMCVRLLVFPYSTETKDDYFILARILMWSISVIGTWLGFGVGCESRAESKRKKEKSRDISVRMKVLFWKPIIFILFLCIIILWMTAVVEDGEIILDCIKKFLIGFLDGTALMFVVLKLFAIPPVILSDIYFDFVYFLYKKNISIHARYGRLRYKIENRTLFIDDAKCVYVGHEKDLHFKDMIHEDPIPLYGNRTPKINDPEGIKNLLKNTNSRREKDIASCFEECVVELKKNKEKSL